LLGLRDDFPDRPLMPELRQRVLYAAGDVAGTGGDDMSWIAAGPYHDLDFSQPTPMGFALCKVCGGYFTREQFLEWRCPGAKTEEVSTPPRQWLGALTCAICGEAIVVDPMHREIVKLFGSRCGKCFFESFAPVGIDR
jgi:hypothetical protein